MLKLIQSYLAEPLPLEIAKKELEQAHRALLQAQSNSEYSRQMVEYNQARIRRLATYLDTQKAV
jgi:hypothetical protein